MQRDGAALWAWLLLPWVVALIWWLLWRRHHHQHVDVGIVVAVIFGLAAVSIGLATLWVTWAALRFAQRSADMTTSPSLAEMADRLAGGLRSQWAAEARARGLNDPYPLPVAWTAADPPLAGDLNALKRVATSGAGWSARMQKKWAKGPADLAGSGSELVEVLARVPTGGSWS